MTQTLLPALILERDVQTELAALMRERILEPAGNAGLELAQFGTSVLPEAQTICRTHHGTWLFVNQRDDPTAADYGGRIPLPVRQHERLTALAVAGVRPDHLWLAHELPSEWDGTTLPRLVPAPAPLRQQDELLLNRVRQFFRTAGDVALGLGGAVIAGLDPIVLGGVQHPKMPVVSWVVLAQWSWD